jgi:hypothetical protein
MVTQKCLIEAGEIRCAHPAEENVSIIKVSIVLAISAVFEANALRVVLELSK